MSYPICVKIGDVIKLLECLILKIAAYYRDI